MTRKTTYFLLFVLLIMISYFGWPAQSPIRTSQLLQSLSTQEQDDLEMFCQYLMRETEFGYTLFGDKPMTCLFYADKMSDMDLGFWYRKKLIVYRSLPILKKILAKLPTKKFILADSKENGVYKVYLVNKHAVIQTVLKNRSIFEQFYPTNSNPEQLPDVILTESVLSEIISGGNTHLLGILLGYGTQNSILFYQIQQIERDLEDQQMPPGRLLNSSNFLYLQTKLNDLKNKLHPAVDHSVNEISSISFPMFLCDQENQETKDLLNRYKKQQRTLQKILSSGPLAVQFIKKLSEDNL